MNKKGPIIMVEADADDREIMLNVFEDLHYKNDLVFLKDGEEALEYLTKSPVEPFIVFSDINLPRLNGIKLRKMVNENGALRMKSNPYILFTTAAAPKDVQSAYTASVQGFFIKPHNYKELKETIRTIISYWEKCLSP